MAQINRKDLHKLWIHSREEDTEKEMVLRPADYDFPLTRQPRESFELKHDGTLVKGSPSPSDSLEEQQGRWELQDDNLALFKGSESKPSRKLQIVSVDPDRLLVKK
jgi:hypothetical protein